MDLSATYFRDFESGLVHCTYLEGCTKAEVAQANLRGSRSSAYFCVGEQYILLNVKM